MLINNTVLSTNPALLWLGEHNNLVKQVTAHLKAFFCKKNGCDSCMQCKQITQRQHHAIRWYLPESHYTIEDIATMQRATSFALDHEQHYFIIIQKADCLTPLCSNRLLKSIEEPAAGYHFLLLSEHKEALLKTVRSRCLITTWTQTTFQSQDHPLLAYFNDEKKVSPLQFMEDLHTSALNEQQTIQLSDTLLHNLINQYRDAITTNNQQKSNYLDKVITTLKKLVYKPIMPGSSKLFWKNLFLHIN